MAASLAIVGGGPAGLMAAEIARAAGIEVDVYDAMGSVGRKFLIAGKGGLNLTHAEAFDTFVTRYGERHDEIQRWLQVFDAAALREWARGLGVDTFVGSSGRVFPSDLKAAPLLRRWVKRLRDSGVRFHVRQRCIGWGADQELRFDTPEGERCVKSDAVLLACGGGSWPELGSDGSWVQWLSAAGVEVAVLQPSNCGFEVSWSERFHTRFAGQPVKPVALSCPASVGAQHRQGEFVVSAQGIEGSLVYAWSARLRNLISRDGSVDIELDLMPERDIEELRRALSRPRGGRSIGEFLRRAIGLDGVRAGLLFERAPRSDWNDADKLAHWIKCVPIRLERARPLAEVISSAGGVRFEALDESLMLRARPGVFCAGEMIDWEAPTGGYLLTACFASGVIAGRGVVRWLAEIR
jgi:uncharacterized flavoprotein (TIGR03862 family)